METENILQGVSQALDDASTPEEALKSTVAILADKVPHYHWTGFYLVNGDELQVGPYVGDPTPHTRIKIGEGICGAAAEAKETIIVDDVNSDPRYLACSVKTKSEIVVPLLDGDTVLGEIDIDSHDPAAFGSDDKQLLEAVAEKVVATIKRLSH